MLLAPLILLDVSVLLFKPNAPSPSLGKADTLGPSTLAALDFDGGACMLLAPLILLLVKFFFWFPSPASNSDAPCTLLYKHGRFGMIFPIFK